jgi:hypothetical protein
MFRGLSQLLNGFEVVKAAALFGGGGEHVRVSLGALAMTS